MTGRACHALEQNPAYVDVAIRRWQAFTGEAAILGADGRRFDGIRVLDAQIALIELEATKPSR